MTIILYFLLESKNFCIEKNNQGPHNEVLSIYVHVPNCINADTGEEKLQEKNAIIKYVKKDANEYDN